MTYYTFSLFLTAFLLVGTTDTVTTEETTLTPDLNEEVHYTRECCPYPPPPPEGGGDS